MDKPNIYAQLFTGVKPVSDEVQAELDRMEEAGWERLATMSEEEKAAEFDRIMGRKE